MVETKIDSTGTHVKNYAIDSKELDLQEPIDEKVKASENNLRYEPILAGSKIKAQVVKENPIITSHSTLPEVDLKPVQPKPAKLGIVKDTLVDEVTKPIVIIDINSKPVAVKPISIKPVKAKPVKDTIAAKPVSTKKPKPVKDTIVNGKPDVVATKPVKAKPASTKAPTKKPKPVKDTVVDGKPDIVATKPVKAKPNKPLAVKPPTKKPVKVKPAKPAKPAKPTKPVVPENDIKVPNQGPFPGLSFLWSLYRRPLVTVVGAVLNRPETGLNWIPFIANAPTLPPWPPKLPWERFPIIGSG